MYNMKIKEQLSHEPKNADMIHSWRTFTPSHHIGVVLCFHNYDRNNTMLKLISAPNYDLCVASQQCLRWRPLANSVIDNMTSNLVKNLLPMFHSDNIDYTPNGKNTSHLLIICIFQRRICERAP